MALVRAAEGFFSAAAAAAEVLKVIRSSWPQTTSHANSVQSRKLILTTEIQLPAEQLQQMFKLKPTWW